MSKFYLVWKDETGRSHRALLTERGANIGRLPTNEVVLTDPTVSRVHSRIDWESGSFVLRDLGTKNGTFVNGQRIQAKGLKKNDEVKLGEAVLKFTEDIPPQISYQEKTSKDEPFTIVKEIPTSTDVFVREHRTLQILYNLSQTLNSSLSLDELLSKVCDSIFEIIKADRLLIMLKDEKTGQFIPRLTDTPSLTSPGAEASEISGAEQKEEKFVISKTVIKQVEERGVSILVYDVEKDSRFQNAQSLVLKGVKSCICVPVWREKEIIGLIYVDNHLKKRSFTEPDLDLLTAVGNQAALAIWNMKTQEKLFQKKRVEHDLEIARDIQKNFLPKEFPPYGDFSLYAMTQPALKVGGDFFDYFESGRDKLSLVLGDISGKGVAAALYMAKLLGDFRKEALACVNARETLSRMNRILLKTAPPGMYVTAVYVVVDLKEKLITYSSAGHPPLLHLEGASGRINELVLDEGLPLGIEPDAVFTEGTVALKRGDVLLGYTDGVTEARNPAGEPLGTAGLGKLLASFMPSDPEKLVKGIIREVDSFGSYLHDDSTVLALMRS